jgi:plasmid stability protein
MRSVANKITVQDLDDAVVDRLKLRAWREGVPLEESVKRVLTEATRSRGIRQLEEVYPLPTD